MQKTVFGQVRQKMRVEIVDLYQSYGISKPDGAVGRLTCWLQATSEKISPRRQRPGVLILPGGGYSHVSPREGEPVALRFAAKGYQAFALEYTCAPAGFPVAIREACMAMAYIRQHADAFEMDPNQVAALGFSAGGHLCGTLGTMYDCPEVADLGSKELLRPDALILCYPVAVQWGRTHEGTFANISMGDSDLRQRLSLDHLVRPDMPPVFLWHTRDDGSVPVRNSLILAQALEEQGADFAMHIYRHGPHGLSTADEMVYPVEEVPESSWDVPGWVDSAMAFLKEIGFSAKDMRGNV